MWCVIPKLFIWRQIDGFLSYKRKHTYWHLFITNTFCTCVIYVYVQIHQIFTKNYQICVCTILSNTPVIASLFLYMSYDFTMWLGARWDQKVQHFQRGTECRGNKDVFTPLISTSTHTPGSPPNRILPKSVSKSAIQGVFLSGRKQILLIEESLNWRAAGV